MLFRLCWSPPQRGTKFSLFFTMFSICYLVGQGTSPKLQLRVSAPSWIHRKFKKLLLPDKPKSPKSLQQWCAISRRVVQTSGYHHLYLKQSVLAVFNLCANMQVAKRAENCPFLFFGTSVKIPLRGVDVDWHGKVSIRIIHIFHQL